MLWGAACDPALMCDVTGPARSGVASRVVRARARVPCYTTVRRFGGLPAPARATGRPMRLETRHEATDTWWDAGIESWLSDHRSDLPRPDTAGPSTRRGATMHRHPISNRS